MHQATTYKPMCIIIYAGEHGKKWPGQAITLHYAAFDNDNTMNVKNKTRSRTALVSYNLQIMANTGQ